MSALSFVRCLPLETGEVIQVEVVPMTHALAQLWHEDCQPEIDNSTRADRGWNWMRIRGRFHFLASALQQSPEAFCLRAERDGADPWSIGMLMLAGHYPALDDIDQDAVFAWFLAVAPHEGMVRQLGVRPKKIGQALMDMVLTQSKLLGYGGRAGLHAAPSGGDELLRYYTTTIGLQRLPQSAPLPGVREVMGNDGRYFFADEPTANRILARMSALK